MNKYKAECKECGVKCTLESEKKSNYSIKCHCDTVKWLKLEEVENEF